MMEELSIKQLEEISAGGKISTAINAGAGYALFCAGMCVAASNPIGWGIIAGGAYCEYNAYRDKYGR